MRARVVQGPDVRLRLGPHHGERRARAGGEVRVPVRGVQRADFRSGPQHAQPDAQSGAPAEVPRLHRHHENRAPRQDGGLRPLRDRGAALPNPALGRAVAPPAAEEQQRRHLGRREVAVEGADGPVRRSGDAVPGPAELAGGVPQDHALAERFPRAGHEERRRRSGRHDGERLLRSGKEEPGGHSAGRADGVRDGLQRERPRQERPRSIPQSSGGG
mmetsp:Transcript_24520/g.61728  ORF Transcript_24520/g.61728 Transcript_24520/m.61728 type:complete len:216 (-) Transcript_24520:396-1043(-)